MNNQLNFPVGISDFKKIRENDYYIDKSGLIKELLKRESAEVTLIIRPRRFGKTMGMGMLAHFLIYGPITGGYSMVLKLSTMKHCAVPVSYTHLDVYKRQCSNK